MNLSLKFLAGVVSASGLWLVASLPSLAQMPSPTTPTPDSTTPSAAPAPSPEQNPNPSIFNEAPYNRNQATPQTPAVQVPASTTSMTIDGIVRQSPSFEMFNALLRVADLRQDLSKTLSSDGSYTAFVPTDEAFAALPEGTVKALVQPENRDLLVKILTYHVVPENLRSNNIKSGAIESLEGSNLSVQSSGTGVTVNNAQVIAADIQASNGVIHAINRVILPPDLQTQLTGLVPQTGTTSRPQ